MSESTSNRTADASAEAAAPSAVAGTPQSPELSRTALSAARKERSALWTALSLLLHGTVIAALLFIAFRRTSLEEKQKKKDQRQLSSERVEKLSEHIRKASLEQLRKDVLDIMTTKAAIEELMPPRNEVYAAFSREMFKQGDVNSAPALGASAQAVRVAGEAWQRFDEEQRKLDALAFGAQSSADPTQRLNAIQAARKLGDELTVALTALESTQESALASVSWTTPPEITRRLEELFRQAGALREAQKKNADLLNELAQSSLATPELGTAVEQMRKDLNLLQKMQQERQDAVTKAAQEATAGEEVLKKAEAALQSAQKEAQQAQQALQQARQEKKSEVELNALKEGAKKAADAQAAAQKSLEERQRQRLSGRGALERAQRSAELMRTRYEQQKLGCDRFSELIEKSRQAALVTVPAWRALRQESAAQMRKLQESRQALDRQLDAPAQKSHRPEPRQVSARENPASEEAARQSDRLDSLYRNADTLEGLSVEEYRDLRAIELSMLRHMPFERAHGNIDAPKPERATVPAEDLDGTPVNTAGLTRQKEAIRTALDEAARMREYCRSLLQMLQSEESGATVALYRVPDPEHPDKQPSADDKPVTLGDLVQMLKQMLQTQVQPMQKLAGLTEAARMTPDAEVRPATEADNAADGAVDLLAQAIDSLDDDIRRPQDMNTAAATLLLAAEKIATTAKEERTAESGSRGLRRPLPEQTAREAAEEAEKMAGQMGKMAKMAQAFAQAQMAGSDSAEAMRMSMLKAQMMAGAASGTFAESADVSGLMKSDPKKFGGGASPESLGLRTDVPHPELKMETKGISGGRILSAAGTITSSWMVVDSWYVIGPWPNPARANMDKKYPPENSIDLDATYPGKDGMQLRWRFMQSPKIMLQPTDPRDYAIYYLYTEVRSDADRDIWLVTGSDDKSKIWINDMLIWESRPELKAWRIGEGFRKVHLRKGVNKILYRLENGWYSVAMSLLFCTGLEGGGEAHNLPIQ